MDAVNDKKDLSKSWERLKCTLLACADEAPFMERPLLGAFVRVLDFARTLGSENK